MIKLCLPRKVQQAQDMNGIIVQAHTIFWSSAHQYSATCTLSLAIRHLSLVYTLHL